ncbi:hypothetical protein MLD38_012380 [Melastoma candidum]|uniref:Uncharacterized protein n=1 Tax=Melastoma candidum TaxID=119954 RepID=A0ACB9R973_9MYRT|nr:hypothetical protein MLD38_012380 [Melastoma candidum]
MSSKSTGKTNQSGTSSSRSRHGARVVAQTPIDAKLHEEFEESEGLFDYSSSVDLNASVTPSNVPSSTISAYLKIVQRGGLIQPFGCLLAVDVQTLTVLAYSENVPEMLELTPHAVPSIEQQEGLAFGLQGSLFYAVLHRIDVGLVIDLEPVSPADLPVTTAGALKSYKLAARAISKIQALPSGSLSVLCDALVKEVSELTGYDRIMVYKFHEDEHGEVIAEICRSDLEPYLGLHFPATDIPQASRFLFMKNKVRMICDCRASPVRVLQDKKLEQPLSLGGSTLRSPHGCHTQYMANMGSTASLVMSVTINEDEDDTGSSPLFLKKLWGLVVCHHASPRFVPFPLRYACEFLIQVFSVHLNKEVELAAQAREKHMLRTQTVLCDMLLRDAPVGIITQSPNVMDLVKCDGAALYYRQKFWSLGVTPTESQIREIASWLLEYHSGSTGLSTDSLAEAGYPGASALGDAVCGMASVRITSKDFLFWFRSVTAKEVKWGGAKHDPKERDDGRVMHPRSSFQAFLDVVKQRSIPWEDVEMDAIHSLQLILRDSLPDSINDDSKPIVNVPSADSDPADGSSRKVDELRKVTNEMVRLIETAAVPIFAVDASGKINGWNIKAAEITGLSVHHAIGKPLVDLVESNSIGRVKRLISSAIQGIEERNTEIGLKTHNSPSNDVPVVVVVNSCCSCDTKENVVGVCFVGQDITGQKLIMDKYTSIQGDFVGIVRNPSVLIPPIFMTDEQGRCSEWNDAMQKLSGLRRDEVTEKILLGEVFTCTNFGCRVKDHDTLTKLRILLNGVIAGEEMDKLTFGFFDRSGKYIEALLSANKRVDSEGNINGTLCFLHVMSPELQYAMQMQKASEQAAEDSLKRLAYIRQELKKPLSGITFIQTLMESTEFSDEQRSLFKTSTLCREQLAKIVNDTDIESIEDCYMDLSSHEFNLGETLRVVINQATTLSTERGVGIVLDAPGELSTVNLFGDRLRLQQVLSEFLSTALLFTPANEGSSVMLAMVSRKEQIGTKMHILHLEFRVTHPAPGVPQSLIHQMFHHDRNATREGLGLFISQKLVKIMNGTVQYLRGAEKSSFIILVEFPLVRFHHG